MTLVFMIAAIAVIAVVAMLAVGRLGELPDAEGDRAPLALPDDRPLDGDDVDGVRFAVGLRGYRMDEVDDVLDRLSDDLAARDARIAELESQLAAPYGDAAAAAASVVAPLTDQEPAFAADVDPVAGAPEPAAPVDRAVGERPGGDEGSAHA